ncbi:MAG: TerB family tellurite resistance protein [Myxococcota bacterium]
MTTPANADAKTFDAVLMLYLACAKLPDGELDTDEGARILRLTQQHTQALAAGYAEQAVRDVAQTLAAADSPEAQLGLVNDAATHLAATLSADGKAQVVADLRSIAKSDGSDADERGFLRAVVRTLGVD